MTIMLEQDANILNVILVKKGNISLMKTIDHEFREDNFACPHCGYVFSDCWEWPENGEDECCECKGKFSYCKEFTTHYCTEIIF